MIVAFDDSKKTEISFWDELSKPVIGKAPPTQKISKLKKDEVPPHLLAYGNLRLSDGDKKILYDRHREEIKDFVKFLSPTRAIYNNPYFDKSVDVLTTTEYHPNKETKNEDDLIIDSALQEIKLLKEHIIELKIELFNLKSSTPEDLLNIKAKPIYVRQKKKIKRLKEIIDEMLEKEDF